MPCLNVEPDNTIQVVIEDHAGNVLFEREQSNEDRYNDSRSRRFVTFTNSLGLYAVPCNTPNGPQWTVRAIDIPAFAQDNRYTVIESVFGDTPESAAQRAVDTYGQEILFADPKAAAKQEQQRQQTTQEIHNKTYARPRPGNR